jgi:hypothetical protein
MTDSEEHSLAVDSIIKVIQGTPILIVQNHIAEILYERDKPGHKIYLGNGTTGVFWTYEKDLDAIVAKVQLASKEVYVRIKRRDFSTTTKLRSQFPIMLAWAATIHKVQGMEFDSLEVDFCLDTLGNSGQNEFYQGLAYMVLSRAETVVVVGRLTLALLNNVNLESLAWWNSQIEIWNSFKSKSRATPEKQFRNAIHMHNWHAAAAQRSCQAMVAAQKSILVLKTPEKRTAEQLDAGADNSDPSAHLHDCHAAALQKNVSASAPAQAPASAYVPVSATAHNPTPSIAGFASVSAAPAAKQPAPAPAPAPNPATASDPARVSASALTTVVNSKRHFTPTDYGESDGDFELIVLPPVTPPEKRPAAPAPAATVPNQASALSTAANAQRSKRCRILPTEKQVSDMIDKSYSEVITHPQMLNQYKKMSSQTYGESNIPLVSKLVAKNKQMEGKIFVDLGSGVGQVCMMVAALSRASKCFGIELMPNPARYAPNLLANFQSRAQQSGVTLCPIELIEGDFLKSEAVKTALSSAGLVYMNNPRFTPDLNLQVLSE